MCSCASNKPARVGRATGSSVVGSVPTLADGTVSGATSTALSGGQVLTGARRGAAGSAAGAIIRELLK